MGLVMLHRIDKTDPADVDALKDALARLEQAGETIQCFTERADAWLIYTTPRPDDVVELRTAIW